MVNQIRYKGGRGRVLVHHTTQTAQQHATSVNTTTTALQPSIPEKQVGGELRSNKLIKLTKLDTATGRGLILHTTLAAAQQHQPIKQQRHNNEVQNHKK